MPSQEEYLDNLLKGIETENTETEVTKEPKMTGTEEETAKAPETPEPVEESGTQVDMSDMDDLLQSALDAQKADSSEQETEASQPVAENTAILPEETASMSEDEINRLLQQSQEQSGDAPAQESNDANDDLIKMLENADDEGLSNILDQVTPETAQPEETAEREEDNGKRGKKKKEKKKKEKKLGFFERFKKKSKEEPEAAPDETESAQPAGEEVTSDIPETVPDDLADLSSLTDGMDDTDKTPMEASDNTESVESTENAAENGDAGGLDDDLDALLAGAFPEQSENSTDNASGEPESADVMDILKAAGADIMDEPEQKKEKKGFFAKLLDLFTEEDEEEEDPRAELVQQLLEYKMYKCMAYELRDRQMDAERVLFKEPTIPPEVAEYEEPINMEELVSDVTLARLNEIFKSIMKKQVDKIDPIRSKFGKIEKEEVSLSDKMAYLENYCLTHSRFSFRSLLEAQAGKMEIIVTFLAILELMKTGKIFISQEHTFDDILIQSKIVA